MPMNFLLIEGLERIGNFECRGTFEFPTSSGKFLTCHEITALMWQRTVNLFLPDKNGERPCNGNHPLFRKSRFKDVIRFHEYFDGNNGRGCGASFQGWTFLVLIALRKVGESRVSKK